MGPIGNVSIDQCTDCLMYQLMTASSCFAALAVMDTGTDHAEGVSFCWIWHKKKSPHLMMRGLQKKAAAYSPTWCSSTIGADGLNFPVRNGKGWAPSPWPPKIFVPELVPVPNIVDIIMGQGGRIGRTLVR